MMDPSLILPIECPHCAYETISATQLRWHLEKCHRVAPVAQPSALTAPGFRDIEPGP